MKLLEIVLVITSLSASADAAIKRIHHHAVEDFKSAWGAGADQTRAGYPGIEGGDSAPPASRRTCSIDSYAWQIDIDAARNPPVLYRQNRLDPLSLPVRWGELPEGNDYSPLIAAHGKVWGFVQRGGEWSLISASMLNDQVLWSVKGHYGRDPITGFYLDPDGDPILYRTQSKTGTVTETRGTFTGGGESIQWESPRRVPAAEAKKAANRFQRPGAKPEIIGEFDLGEPGTLLAFSWNDNRRDRVTVRYRVSQDVSDRYGPWSEPLDRTSVQLNQVGRFLQYQLTPKTHEPGDGDNQSEFILTYKENEDGETGKYQPAGHSSGSGSGGADADFKDIEHKHQDKDELERPKKDELAQNPLKKQSKDSSTPDNSETSVNSNNLASEENQSNTQNNNKNKDNNNADNSNPNSEKPYEQNDPAVNAGKPSETNPSNPDLNQDTNPNKKEMNDSEKNPVPSDKPNDSDDEDENESKESDSERDTPDTPGNSSPTDNPQNQNDSPSSPNSPSDGNPASGASADPSSDTPAAPGQGTGSGHGSGQAGSGPSAGTGNGQGSNAAPDSDGGNGNGDNSSPSNGNDSKSADEKQSPRTNDPTSLKTAPKQPTQHEPKAPKDKDENPENNPAEMKRGSARPNAMGNEGQAGQSPTDSDAGTQSDKSEMQDGEASGGGREEEGEDSGAGNGISGSFSPLSTDCMVITPGSRMNGGGSASASSRVLQPVTQTIAAPLSGSKIQLSNLKDRKSWPWFWWLLALLSGPLAHYEIKRRKAFAQARQNMRNPEEERFWKQDWIQSIDESNPVWEGTVRFNPDVSAVDIWGDKLVLLHENRTVCQVPIFELTARPGKEEMGGNTSPATVITQLKSPFQQAQIVRRKNGLYILGVNGNDKVKGIGIPIKDDGRCGWNRSIPYPKELTHIIQTHSCCGRVWALGENGSQRKLFSIAVSGAKAGEWREERPAELEGGRIIAVSSGDEPLIAGVPENDPDHVWVYRKDKYRSSPRAWKPIGKIAYRTDEMILCADEDRCYILENAEEAGELTITLCTRNKQGQFTGHVSNSIPLSEPIALQDMRIVNGYLVVAGREVPQYKLDRTSLVLMAARAGDVLKYQSSMAA